MDMRVREPSALNKGKLLEEQVRLKALSRNVGRKGVFEQRTEILDFLNRDPTPHRSLIVADAANVAVLIAEAQIREIKQGDRWNFLRDFLNSALYLRTLGLDHIQRGFLDPDERIAFSGIVAKEILGFSRETLDWRTFEMACLNLELRMKTGAVPDLGVNMLAFAMGGDKYAALAVASHKISGKTFYRVSTPCPGISNETVRERVIDRMRLSFDEPG